MQGDELSLIISPCSHLRDCAQTGDDYSEEESEPAYEAERGMAKQETINKSGYLHAL